MCKDFQMSGIHILVVEDSEIDFMAVERLVKNLKLPYVLDWARTVVQAENELTKSSYDLIMIDHRLPDGSGLDVQKKCGKIPTIFITGSADIGVAVEAMRVGADDFLIKDPRGEYVKLLPEVIEKAFARKRMEQELSRYRIELERLVYERTKSLEQSNRSLINQIEERKKIEEALRQSEANYRSLVEASPDVILRFDHRMRLRYVDPHTSRHFGILGRRPEGKTPQELDIEPELRDFWLAQLKSIFAQAASIETETRITLHGAAHIYNWRLVPEKNRQGQTVGVVAIGRDVTDRRKTAEETRHLREQLLQSQKMEAIGRLAGGVAHDFNNLLTAILVYSELLLDEHQDARVKEPVQEIKQAAKRAESLVRQLLAYSRRQVMRPRRLDFNEILQNMEKMLGRVIGEDIHLMLNCRNGLGKIWADVGQIEQVIMNLAVNARDAMPQGGDLSIDTSTIFLDAAAVEKYPGLQVGDYVVVNVRDTGEGMDLSTQDRIFEPFFTTKKMGHGTGLGLSTVYGIVTQSQGHICVRSEPGKGTRFKIFFPQVDEAETTHDHQAFYDTEESAFGDLKGDETILVVEDEDIILSLTSKVLTHYGYRILTAADSDQALSRVKEHVGPIHLLLTDVVLPGEGGKKIADAVVRFHPGLKVLYMSGYADEAIMHHGEIGSDTPLLQKPFSPKLLVQKVRWVLDRINPML